MSGIIIALVVVYVFAMVAFTISIYNSFRDTNKKSPTVTATLVPAQLIQPVLSNTSTFGLNITGTTAILLAANGTALSTPGTTEQEFDAVVIGIQPGEGYVTQVRILTNLDLKAAQTFEVFSKDLTSTTTSTKIGTFVCPSDKSFVTFPRIMSVGENDAITVAWKSDGVNPAGPTTVQLVWQSEL